MERIGLAPGSEVGGYRIVSPLGSGGMGTVYRAVDGGGTVVALKLLHPHIGADPVARERLRREVVALQRLHHPAVAAVLDAEADSTEAFIVTELVQGDTLEEHVRAHGPLDPDELADLAEDLRDALQAVHAAGVVHRDLKPSNLLVTDDGPVLIDFGIAQSADDARFTSTGLVSGTPGYLPPEMLDGADPSAASDWWGWAALLAFAATGRAPFGVRPVEVVLARARSGDADLEGADPVTAQALRGALAADPAGRWPADDVVDALRRAADDPQAAVPTAVVGSPSTGAPAPTAATAVLAPSGTQDDAGAAATSVLAPTHDGRTQMLGTEAPSPEVEDDDPWQSGRAGDPAVPDDRFGTDDLDDLDDDVYEAPSPARRRGSVAALGALVVASAALWPGFTFLAGVVLLLVLRTVGESAQSLHRRRERAGVRRSDGLRGAVALPWHVVRAAVGLVPSLLVGLSVAVIVAGVLRWTSADGSRSGGTGWSVVIGGGSGAAAGTAAGAPGTDLTLCVVLAAAALCGVLALWWGPLAGLTRDGARRTLGGLAPGRGGSRAFVLLALAGAAVLVLLAVTGTSIDWTPLAEPTLPGG